MEHRTTIIVDTPTVQLLHALPGGRSHIDWMISPDPLGEGPLTTFRAERRLDDLEPGQTMPLVRIADHRARYLRYEGPLSGDRGSVRRLAEGRVRRGTLSPQTANLVIEWADPARPARPEPPHHLRLEHVSGDRWRAARTDGEAASPRR